MRLSSTVVSALNNKKFLLSATMITAAAMLLGTAWVGDDAFITLRVIDNFVNGWGLRFNVIERVQVYTHPLWLLFLTPFYFLTREPLLTTMLVSVALSLSALWLLGVKIASHWQRGCLLVLAAMISGSIMSFSTSGLETPLTFLLLALFVWQLYLPGKTWVVAGIAGLLFLNRLDLAVLLGPAVACILLQERVLKNRIKIILAASLPTLFWTAFSLVYYGAPFPNTAYAKLGTGVDVISLMIQGTHYLLYFLQADSLLALIIGKAVFDSLTSPYILIRMLGLGIVLYIAYIIIIGGDFMLGRFFSVPGFLALCVLSRMPSLKYEQKNNLWFATLGVIVLCWTLLIVRNMHHEYWDSAKHGIADERLAYYEQNGFLPVLRELFLTGYEPHHANRDIGLLWKDKSQASLKNIVALANNPGMQGYYAGPAVHLVDVLALTDAFLARLPAVSKPLPRVGHYGRLVPFGYSETILNTNPTTDIELLHPLLDDVVLITRAPIFLPERWSAIWRLFFEQKYYDLSHIENGAIKGGTYEYYEALPRVIDDKQPPSILQIPQ